MQEYMKNIAICAETMFIISMPVKAILRLFSTSHIGATRRIAANFVGLPGGKHFMLSRRWRPLKSQKNVQRPRRLSFESASASIIIAG
jgi:hypothetical protein